jgi:cobalamin biosynthesis protein CobT
MSGNFYNFGRSEYSGLAEFSTMVGENPFGAQLLATLENHYDDIDTAVEDLVDSMQAAGYTDFDEEVALQLMVGQAIPEEGFLEVISELCEDEIEEERLVNSAIASIEMAEDLLDAMEEEDYEDEEEYDDDDIYDEYDDEDDEYDDEDDEDDYDEADAEELLASYSRYANKVEAMEDSMLVGSYLKNLLNRAENMVDAGTLPPIAFSRIFGENEDYTANFSAVCDEDNVDAASHLDRIEYALSLFEDVGEFLDFSGSVYDGEDFDLDQDEVDELATDIQASFDFWRERSGLSSRDED